MIVRKGGFFSILPAFPVAPQNPVLPVLQQT
jgi:hypothetical protein